MQRKEISKCTICGTRQIVEHERAETLLNLKKPFKVMRCPSCDFAWLTPQPTSQEYEQLYSSQYFAPDGRRPQYQDIVAGRREHFTNRIERIQKRFPDKTLSLLDIGSATGMFLGLCRQAGLDATGLEYSAYAVEEATAMHGDFFAQGDLEHLPERIQGESFDVVHLNHTFEHFVDPVASLESISTLLNDDGILVIEVPYQFDNVIELLRTIRRRDLIQNFELFSLHHPFFYSPKSMRIILEKCGFSVQSLKTYLPKAPVISKSPRGVFLKRYLLSLSDILFKRGDFIEVLAKKK